jgi:hypothetical protein
MYLLITLSLTFLGLLTFLPKFQGVLHRFNSGINFFLTLIATLVGVLLAIMITDYEAEQKEKQDLVKLLRSATAVVETSYEYSEELVEYYDTLEDKDPIKETFYAKNSPPYPDYLDSLLTQNLASKNLSQAVLTDLNEQVINLKKTRHYRAPLYLIVLNQTRDILKLEIQYQQGEIDSVKLQSELDKIKNQLDITTANNQIKKGL